MSPELYYTKIKIDNSSNEYWNSLPIEDRNKISIYDVIEKDLQLQNIYIEIFNFFFIETVVYQNGLFILLNEKVSNPNEITNEQLCGMITRENFLQAIELIQQVCCIYNDEKSLDDMNFKNNLAKKLMEKMIKAKKKEQEEKRFNLNLTIPNIISSLANKHTSLNYINIWDLTIFQLLDAFNRVQLNSMYDIDSTRVSVWGDEKKTFDISLWYKNNYDEK